MVSRFFQLLEDLILGVRTYLEAGQKASARTAWSCARMHRYGSRVSDLSASCTRKSVDLEVRSHSPTTPGESRDVCHVKPVKMAGDKPSDC